MGNVIYTGNNKIQTQNNSPVVLFDSGTITFNQDIDNDNYKKYNWYDENGTQITSSSNHNFSPYRIMDYTQVDSTSGWYNNYWSGIKIPVTVEKFLSYSEIMITTLYTPNSAYNYLFLSNYENLQDNSGIFLEVTLNNSGSSSARYYSVYQFINLGNGLFLSNNLLCDQTDGTALQKTSRIVSIDSVNIQSIDSSGYRTFLYDLTNVDSNSSLFLKNFQAGKYTSTKETSRVYPIGVGYKDLRIIITGR